MTDSRYKTKICLVGESAVGKTSLIKKFVLDIFDDEYISTIGTKVTKKTLTYQEDGSEVLMDMMVWDIMGQPSFRSLLKDAYFFGAHGIIAVCDATKKDTLIAVHEWVDSTKEVIGKVPIVFLANKHDLEDQLQIDEATFKKEVEKYGMPTMFSSAKTGENVESAFNLLGQMIIDNLMKSRD